MLSKHPTRQRWLVSLAATLLCGCSMLPSRAPPPPPPVPGPAASTTSTPPPPEETQPSSEGGSGGLSSGMPGNAPDPNTSPEAFASYQLEEVALAMDEDLRGTPVEVQRNEANALRVAVPTTYCFDTRRSAVKQPLAAVLDRVAAQIKLKTSLHAVVIGPSDAGDATALLALDRAAAARDYLISRGVPASRLAVQNQPSTAGLEIRIATRKGLRGGITEPARTPAPPRQQDLTTPASR